MRTVLLVCLIGALELGVSVYEPMEASSDLERDAKA